MIPEDWGVSRLADLTDARRPISYGIVQTGRNLPDGVRCIRVVDIVNGRVDESGLICTSKKISDAYSRTLLRQNDLVIPLRGKVGEVAVVGDTVAGANLTRGVALIAVKPGVSPMFCRQAISAPASRGRMEGSLNGSALQEIPIATLRCFEIPLPPTLAEQQAIAEALSDADALIESLEKLIAKKRLIKQGAMQELLTGKRRLPGFSGEWERCLLGEVADVKTGPFGSALHEKDYVSDGVPIITVEHLGERGVIQGSNLPRVSASDYSRLNMYRLAIGDIVFSRVGAIDRNALIGESENGWLFSGRLLRVRPNHAKVLSPYLSHQFHGEEFKARVRDVAVGQTMACLNTRILQGVEIVVPCLKEQTAIASVLSEMDVELDALEAKLAKARLIKQGMMQELLTGRIRLV